MATVQTARLELLIDAPRIQTARIELLPTPLAPAKVQTARIELLVQPTATEAVVVGGAWTGVSAIVRATGGVWT